jgi:recombination associated protein RdgC
MGINNMFKNIIAYTFNKPFSTSQASLELALSDLEFSPCGSQDISKFGFTSALGNKGGWLAHEYEGRYLICATKEEKILPSQVIKDELYEAVSKIEITERRKVSKKEEDAIKDEIVTTLLPQAFTRKSQTRALILPEINMILVDSSSALKAESLLALLRKALGSLPVICLGFENDASEIMTAWVSESHSSFDMTILNEAEMKDDGGAVAKFKDQELSESEVLDHIANGKKVNKLALKFSNSISFVMCADNSIKRVKFSEEFKSLNDDVGDDDPMARLEADLALVSSELIALMSHLPEAFGGIQAK